MDSENLTLSWSELMLALYWVACASSRHFPSLGSQRISRKSVTSSPGAGKHKLCKTQRNLLSHSLTFPILRILTRELWKDPHWPQQLQGTYFHRWTRQKIWHKILSSHQQSLSLHHYPIWYLKAALHSLANSTQHDSLGQRRCKIWVSHWPLPVWPVAVWCEQPSDKQLLKRGGAKHASAKNPLVLHIYNK